MKIIDFISENQEYLEDIITRSTYQSNVKEERTKYFEFLRDKDVEGLANWLRTLSENEKERIESFKS